MAISVDPSTYVISVPQSDLALISGTLYKLDTDTFRLALKDWEASEDGINHPKTHNHNTTVNLFGVTYARSIEVIAPYSVTFTPDSQWSVRLDGSNNNIGDVEAGILNQNQVQVIPTNSAGLQDLSVMLAASYQGQVVINTVTGQAGTTIPVGTYSTPSNNLVDAEQIADENGITRFVLGTDLTVTEDLTVSGNPYSFVGVSPYITLTASPAANLTGVALSYLTVTGELDGLNVLRDCSIHAVTDVSGFIEKCAFLSSATFNGNALVMECYSNVAGGGYPTFTGSTGNSLEVRDWHGSLEVAGLVDSDHTLEGQGGRCIIAASCTGGHVHVRGSWFEIIDNSGAGCEVYDEREQPSVWNVTASEVNDTGTTGKALEDAGSAGNPWSTPVSGNTTAGTFGELVGTKLLTFQKWIGSFISLK